MPSHAGWFLVNWNQGKLAQSVIFQGVPGVLHPVFPFRFDAADAAAATLSGAWLLCRASGLVSSQTAYPSFHPPEPHPGKWKNWKNWGRSSAGSASGPVFGQMGQLFCATSVLDIENPQQAVWRSSSVGSRLNH